MKTLRWFDDSSIREDTALAMLNTLMTLVSMPSDLHVLVEKCLFLPRELREIGHHGNLHMEIHQFLKFGFDHSVLLVAAMTRQQMDSDSRTLIIKPMNHMLDIGIKMTFVILLLAATGDTVLNIVSMDTGHPPHAGEDGLMPMD